MLLLVAVVGGSFASPGVTIGSPASPGVFIVSPRVSLASSRGSFLSLALIVFLPTSVSASTSVNASVAFLILQTRTLG